MTDDAQTFAAWLNDEPQSEAETPEPPGPRAPRPDASQGAGTPTPREDHSFERWATTDTSPIWHTHPH